MVIFFAFVIAMTIILLNINKFGVSVIDNRSLVMIREDIASDKYVKGDLVLVKAKKIEDIKIGDEIFVYKVDKARKVTIDVGIVGGVHLEDVAISFKNGATFDMEYVIGVADEVHHNIGTYLSIVQSTWGFLFIILVPSFLIFIYQLYALVVEIKYGKDEVAAQPKQAA